MGSIKLTRGLSPVTLFSSQLFEAMVAFLVLPYFTYFTFSSSFAQRDNRTKHSPANFNEMRSVQSPAYYGRISQNGTFRPGEILLLRDGKEATISLDWHVIQLMNQWV